MRIAKPLLMFSLSVFLLAVSWSLLTGQLGAVGPAQAQTSGAFSSIIWAASSDRYYALTEDGGVWTFNSNFTNPSLKQVTYLGHLTGGAVPTTSESLGNMKGKYGGASDN